MGRVWNALRYGDFETRKSIGGVIFFCLLGIILIIVSGFSGQFYLFIMGMLAGVVALILSQSFTLVDDDFVAEVDQEGKKETVKSVSVVKNGVSSSTKSQNSEKQKEDKEEEKKGMQRMRPGREQRERGVAVEVTDFSGINQQVLKKIKRKYHVKKDHRPIMIDNSQTYNIKECPAFIWRVHSKVNLLLLEKEPRRIRISRDMISCVEYVPKVRANREKEYLAFQKENLITSVFEGYLPDYLNANAGEGNLKYKNLYQIYPDIQISNRSIYQVMDLLCIDFVPKDRLTESDKVNQYFKRIYAANILYKDRVYSITEYKDLVEKVLEEMCYMDMPYREFAMTLENLVKARFISDEYADHYTDVRSRVQKNK
ncbi:MAG: hypothetical protein Q4D51_08705 [Eubacteriales bacterium]|nr:hypothetical protein [Eubacteriales bacterium]